MLMAEPSELYRYQCQAFEFLFRENFASAPTAHFESVLCQNNSAFTKIVK